MRLIIFVKCSMKIKPYLLFFSLFVYNALQTVERSVFQAHSLSFGLFNYRININSVTMGENLIAKKKKKKEQALKIVRQNILLLISTVEGFNEYLILLKKSHNLNHGMKIAFQMHSMNARVRKGKALHFYKVRFCTTVSTSDMMVVLLWS